MRSFPIGSDFIVFVAAVALASPQKLSQGVNAFGLVSSTTPVRFSNDFPSTFTLQSKQNSGDGDKEDCDDFQEPESPLSASPKSRMNDYVASFLEKNHDKESQNDDSLDTARIEDQLKLEDITEATHLVAIPMEQAHELLLELESVQRAILHHCPILLDACIPHASTRLPLLYVQAEEENSLQVTAALGNLVSRLVQKHIFQKAPSEDPGENNNLEGYRPLKMNFQSLEIEGDNNSILSTVGILENDAELDGSIPISMTSAKRFNDFMKELKSAVAAKGWKMTLPPDPNNGDDSVFRPRVSFMELPVTFDENISHYKSKDTDLTDEDMQFLTSENGGNGISPIFWAQWWDDDFAKNIRLREIGVYPRIQVEAPEVARLTRSSLFYLPYETISLPEGSPSMLQEEKRFQDYQEKRMAEEQEKVYKAGEGIDDVDGQPPKMDFSTSDSGSGTTDPDIIMTKTRKRLERIYLESGGEGQTAGDPEEGGQFLPGQLALSNADDNENDDDDDEVDLMAPNHPIQAQEDDYMDSWMKNRIKEAVNSLESEKVRKETKKEPPPPVEDNPVFKAYKEGTLVPKDQQTKKKAKELGPYPGNDHFVGIWRMIDSPTGFEVDDSKEGASENLILRVDGTTAGGPTLDLENKHKAAGGTWKMLPQNNGEVLLRVRLVIPPEKNRILVMEGRVQRMGSQSDLPTASRSFGIPEVEKRAEKATESQSNLLTCSGQVHIEDAITKKNREKIGKFSLMKLHGPKDRSEYTITIPRPVRSLN